MPPILDQLEKWDEERWNLLLNAVKSFTTTQDSIPGAISKQLEEINSLVHSANIQTDFQEFVEATDKKNKEESLEFIPYKSKHGEGSLDTSKQEKPVEVATGKDNEPGQKEAKADSEE